MPCWQAFWNWAQSFGATFEVTEMHPHDESIQRGVMVEIDVSSAAAGESVLFAGSKPLWLF